MTCIERKYVIFNVFYYFSLYDLKIFLSNFITTLFFLYLYRLLFKRGMEGRRSQRRGTTRGHGSSRGRGTRQAQEPVQESREERGETVEAQLGPRAEGGITWQRQFRK